MLRNIAYEQARQLLLDLVQPLGTERVPLSCCAGRILAQELRAEGNVPPFDRSAFDGYAFRAEDVADASKEHPVALRIVEEVPAGSVPTKAVTAGMAVKILTGAPVPEGADAIINYESTEFTHETVTLFAPVRRGANIVTAGEDVKAGQLLASEGMRIDAGLAGTLAGQGVAEPLVYRVPRVGIISTGNEVVEADAPAQPGKIRNTNRHALEAALMLAGMEPRYLGVGRDSAEEIAELYREGLRTCDAVLSTGGVSAGDYDLTPAAIELAGGTVLARGVKLKPGMACAYGHRDGKLACGLSGNPASFLTNFYCVVLPALRKLAGRADALPQEFEVVLANGFNKPSPGGRRLRGRLVLSGGEARFACAEGQGNAVISTAIGCDMMAIVPAGTGKLNAGDRLKGFML